MIRMQDQKKEQKKNKYVKHNEKVQKAKKVGGAVAGVAAVAGVGIAKFGKEAIKHAPEVAKAAVGIAKNVIKL